MMTMLPKHKSSLPLRAPLWLFTVLLILIVFSLYTIIGTIAVIPDYTRLGISLNPLLRIATATAWLILFSLLCGGLALKRRAAFTLIAPVLSAYGLSNIISTWLFAQSDYSRGQLAFAIVATVIALLPIWWIALRRGWLTAISR
ncbi:MAG: hypothetical protein ABI947_09615 [Chloroflexota bacterium]